MDTTHAASSTPFVADASSNFRQIHSIAVPLLDTKKIRMRFGQQGELLISYNGNCGKPIWRAALDNFAKAGFRALFLLSCALPFGAVMALTLDLPATTSAVWILALFVIACIAAVMSSRRSPESIAVTPDALYYGDVPKDRLAYSDIVRLYVDGIGVKAETWPPGEKFDDMRAAPITLVTSTDPEVRRRIFHAIDAAWRNARGTSAPHIPA